MDNEHLVSYFSLFLLSGEIIRTQSHRLIRVRMFNIFLNTRNMKTSIIFYLKMYLVKLIKILNVYYII